MNKNHVSLSCDGCDFLCHAERERYKRIFREENTNEEMLAKEICDEYIKRGLKIKWDIRTRVNVVNEELLKKMKKAGC